MVADAPLAGRFVSQGPTLKMGGMKRALENKNRLVRKLFLNQPGSERAALGGVNDAPAGRSWGKEAMDHFNLSAIGRQ